MNGEIGWWLWERGGLLIGKYTNQDTTILTTFVIYTFNYSMKCEG